MADYCDMTVQADPDNKRVLRVVLTRSAVRNAMSARLIEEMLAMLDREGREAGAIMILGEGRGFCAGSDLAALAAMAPAERSTFEAASGVLARRIMAHPRPVIAAVHGFAVGGGFTLAAACDIVVTAPDARWSLPEVPIGLFPAWGLEPVTLRVGRVRARQLSWGIDTLDGVEAHRIGLADSVAGDPIAEAAAISKRLAALPALQAAMVKDYFSAPRLDAAADSHANALFMKAADSAEAAASFKKFRG